MTDMTDLAANYLTEHGYSFTPLARNDWKALIVSLPAGDSVTVRIYSYDQETDLVIAAADKNGYPTGRDQVRITNGQPALIGALIEAVIDSMLAA